MSVGAIGRVGSGWRWLAIVVLLFALIAEQSVAREQELAPVILDGKVLFKVRGALALPADVRAQEIADRIAQLAADSAVSPNSFQIEPGKDRMTIRAGNVAIVSVVDADAAIDGLTRGQIAEIQLRQIVSGIERYRADRSAPALFKSGLASALATVILMALIFGIRRLFAGLRAAADRHYQSRIEKLKAETRKIVQVERLRSMLRGLFDVTRTLILLALALAYLEFVLAQWPWTRPLSEQVLGLVVRPLQSIGTAVLEAIPGLIFIAVVALLTVYSLKVARLFFGGVAEGTISVEKFHREWAWPTYRLVRLAVIAFAVVVAYPYIPGSDSLAFKGVSVFLGVLFSLGSTSMIANILAGYALVYRRAFKIGDRVHIGEHYGDVVAMRLQATYLRSVKNEEIVIPNSVVLNTGTINYSSLASQHGLILHTTVGIGYETPWRQVEAMLLEAAKRTPGLLPTPEPFVLQKSLGDFCVVYEINVYCDQPLRSAWLYTALHQNILDVFNEHNVQIMTPAYEADPVEPKVVARENWYLSPASPPSPKSGK